MKKLQIALIVIFVFLLVFVSCSIFQPKELKAGMPNTVTLSNGEVVYDLNGEWDSVPKVYGPWSDVAVKRTIIKITQTGSSLIGVLMTNGLHHSKGYVHVRAELDKSGFKKVEIMTSFGPMVSDGYIREDGNKIILDDDEKIRLTLTRR